MRLKASVPPAATTIGPDATIEPVVPPLPIWSVPAVTNVVPGEVLPPARASVPVPDFVRAVADVLSAITEAITSLPGER